MPYLHPGVGGLQLHENALPDVVQRHDVWVNGRWIPLKRSFTPLRTLYFLGDTFLGIGTSGQFVSKDFPSSLHYFCRSCGRVWGSVIVEQSPRHLPVSRPCPDHGPGFLISSSDAYAIYWPRTVCVREIALILKHCHHPGDYMRLLRSSE